MDYQTALTFLLAPTDPGKPVVARADAGQNLPRMRHLLDLLGAPDRRYPAVVVAGTKGKGSTAAIVASIARAAGLRVGLYSQPHLHDYRERVRVAGVPFAEADLIAGVERLRPAVAALDAHPELGQCSTYDLGTALALDHFAAAGVELAVLEIGLGGRYDTVNTVVPRVSVITAISLDHMAVLGDTIEQIAGEKAGIIKPGVPVVAQRQVPAAAAVIARVAAAQGAPLHWADDLVTITPLPGAIDPLDGAQSIKVESPLPPFDGSAALVAALPLLGQFQLPNAAAALGAILLLAEQGVVPLPTDVLSSISGDGSLDRLNRGIGAVRWPGRLEIVRRDPLTIVDGAHNADSAAQLRRALADLFPDRPLTLVLGTSLDKDLAGIADALVPAAARLVLTVSSHPRSASLDLLHRATDRHGIPTDDTADLPAALARAVAVTPPGGLIVATGSLFVVADAREALGLAEPIAV